METTIIKLTLDRETREVEARKIDYGHRQVFRFSPVEMITTHGGKVHSGWMDLKINDNPEHVYTTRDALDIRYSGMRGNGYARTSRMQYVGFRREA